MKRIEIYPPSPAQIAARKNLRPFVKGQPSVHRPISSRNRLQRGFMRALADDWDRHGKIALEAARVIDPMGYIKCIAALMPRQFEQTTPLEELSDDELTAAIEHLRTRISVSAGKGIHAPPQLDAPDVLPALRETERISCGGLDVSGTPFPSGEPLR
jgi:hypothetical protein